jgi:ribosomal protein L29
MKTKDLSILRDKKVDAINVQVDKMQADLIKEMTNFKAGKSSKPTKIRSLKKDIAQALTIAREKELTIQTKD